MFVRKGFNQFEMSDFGHVNELPLRKLGCEFTLFAIQCQVTSMPIALYWKIIFYTVKQSP